MFYQNVDWRSVRRRREEVCAFDAPHAELADQVVGSKFGFGLHGGQQEVEDFFVAGRLFLHLREAEFDLKNVEYKNNSKT